MTQRHRWSDLFRATQRTRIDTSAGFEPSLELSHLHQVQQQVHGYSFDSWAHQTSMQYLLGLRTGKQWFWRDHQGHVYWELSLQVEVSKQQTTIQPWGWVPTPVLQRMSLLGDAGARKRVIVVNARGQLLLCANPSWMDMWAWFAKLVVFCGKLESWLSIRNLLICKSESVHCSVIADSLHSLSMWWIKDEWMAFSLVWGPLKLMIKA